MLSEVNVMTSVAAKVRILSQCSTNGSVASFGTEQEFEEKTSFPATLGGHIEEFVDEPILTLDVMPAQPPHLTLPNYVHRLIALNRSSRSLEFTKPLLGVHSPFNRAMVLLDDVVQILDGSVAAPAPQRLFLLGSGATQADGGGARTLACDMRTPAHTIIEPWILANTASSSQAASRA
jgi:hypothetical protein